jgi:hypothetical protein
MIATQSRTRRLTRADILPLDEYARIRSQSRREIAQLKKYRRLEIGPVATFYFENFATMWSQVQEMLYIEKGGDEQIADELAAYNPLIPQGSELAATVMFEIDDPQRRARTLMQLGGIENRAFIEVNGERIVGEPDPTRENTSPEGKASACNSSALHSLPSKSPRSRRRVRASSPASTIPAMATWRGCPIRSAPPSPRISIETRAGARLGIVEIAGLLVAVPAGGG